MSLYSALSIHVVSEPLTYTGAELRPHFLLEQFGIQGTGLAVFQGPCEVPTGHLVDWEDRLNSDFIRARKMVHVLGEFFGMSLPTAVFFQRLAMAVMSDVLRESGLKEVVDIRRSGDDLFIGERKLSVSIVTSSAVSQLLHIGINLESEGAPVSAVGLSDLGWSDAEIRERFLEPWAKRIAEEWRSASWACTKVKPV